MGIFAGIDAQVLPGKTKERALCRLGLGQAPAPFHHFIYYNDLARLMLRCLLESDKSEPVILATDPDDEISIADAARLVAEAMEFKGEIVFDSTKADGQFQKTCSDGALRALQPDFKFTPLQEAISETAAWFCANYDTCRR
jgi:GDP-L-fucose synthase